MIPVKCLCLMLSLLLVFPTVRGGEEEEEEVIYSNSWAVKVTGGAENARRIAEKHGFVHVGQVG